ncbi:MAG: hypothetical protein PGMFKBFP_01449 [Anaerolineales bacterium]|nr:hypothetical protein [Anaerolineales bacterium]
MVRRAITVERGRGRAPSNFSMTGATNSQPFTSALTGLPGSPIAALPCATPKIVGLPGRMATPCTSTPGSPSLRITSAVISRVEADEPAVINTASHSASAVWAAESNALKSSRTIPYGTASPPARAATAESVYVLTSRTCPGPAA